MSYISCKSLLYSSSNLLCRFPPFLALFFRSYMNFETSSERQYIYISIYLIYIYCISIWDMLCLHYCSSILSTYTYVLCTRRLLLCSLFIWSTVSIWYWFSGYPIYLHWYYICTKQSIIHEYGIPYIHIQYLIWDTVLSSPENLPNLWC